MRVLDGIRVVEAASYLSGPFAAMVFADLGAEVTKVEPPRGDPYRRFGARHGDSSLFFRATNQNKASVSLDLKADSGVAELRSLLANADVFITNWRPGVADRMGLTAETIRADFPHLVWVRVSGYGPDGPKHDMPAYDSIIQARSGAMMATTGLADPDPDAAADDEPDPPASLIADKISAMYAAQTAMAGLLARHRTGTGAVCDVPMIDAMAYFLGPDLAAGHRLPDTDPDGSVIKQIASNRPFRTADSWLMLSPVSGRQLRGALEAVDQLDGWDHVVAGAGDGTTFDRFSDLMTPALLTKTTAEWEQAFKAADVPATAVMTIAEQFADDQAIHNDTWQQVDDVELGPYKQVRFPAFFDGQRADNIAVASPSLSSTD